MKKKKTDSAVIIYICLAALLILAIRYFDDIAGMAVNLWNVFFSLVLGAAVAYVLNIIMVRVERFYFPGSRNKWINSSRRGVSILLSILLVMGIIALIGGLVLPELGKAFGVIGRNVPVFLEEAAGWLEKNNAMNIAAGIKDVDWNSMMDKAVDFAKSGLGDVLNSTITAVGAVVGSVVNFFIGLVFAIYILSGKEKLRSQAGRILRAYVKEDTIIRLRNIYRTADETFSSFIIGKAIDSLIIGIICFVCTTIFRFPYAVLLSVIVGITNIIPYFGPYMGGVIGGVVILIVSPVKVIFWAILILIIQQFDGLYLGPKILGEKTGLRPLWVIFSITVGGSLFGVVGMFLGVPCVAVLSYILNLAIEHFLKKKNIYITPYDNTDEM